MNQVEPRRAVLGAALAGVAITPVAAAFGGLPLEPLTVDPAAAGSGPAATAYDGRNGGGSLGDMRTTGCPGAEGDWVLNSRLKDRISSIRFQGCEVAAVYDTFDSAGNCTGEFEKVSASYESSNRVRNLTNMNNRGGCIRWGRLP
jgi:hypothetical protein